MNLHLFDTFQYIYSGNRYMTICRGVRDGASGYEPNEMPCGGLGYLFNTIYEWAGPEEELVFCIDRPPTFKRKLYETNLPYGKYKGNRDTPDAGIIAQKNMVEEVLKSCGLVTVSVEGYESDDIIASLVKYYKDSYDHIYIHSKDSDLFYLVQDNVEILPLSKDMVRVQDKSGRFQNIFSNGKHITLENWERAVVKGKITKYNTLPLIKLCDGELGDNIPAIADELSWIVVKNLPESDYPRCGDLEFLRNYVLNVTNNDKRTQVIFDLINPIILPYEDVSLYCDDYKSEVANYLAQQFGCKHAKLLNTIKQADAEEMIMKHINLFNER